MENLRIDVKKVQIDQAQKMAILKLGGYIDQVTSSEMEKTLEALLQSQIYRIVIDLKDSEYVSSAGWGIFLSEIRTIRENGGDLKLVGMQQNVLEVFGLLELFYILKSYDTLEEAVTDFLSHSSAK